MRRGSNVAALTRNKDFTTASGYNVNHKILTTGCGLNKLVILRKNTECFYSKTFTNDSKFLNYYSCSDGVHCRTAHNRRKELNNNFTWSNTLVHHEIPAKAPSAPLCLEPFSWCWHANTAIGNNKTPLRHMSSSGPGTVLNANPVNQQTANKVAARLVTGTSRSSHERTIAAQQQRRTLQPFKRWHNDILGKWLLGKQFDPLSSLIASLPTASTLVYHCPSLQAQNGTFAPELFWSGNRGAAESDMRKQSRLGLDRRAGQWPTSSGTKRWGNSLWLWRVCWRHKACCMCACSVCDGA